ncbi:ATP-binding protein [Virgisporangium ochraceum]|uniref:Transcriptional regulator n=1 Tax=Virgisporangium ochraceum TaxID=65505 RepID=A0A8J4A3I3_9ACTN|nr:LuxR family transcriptional regulator [Virgisporangium ochraceum]GIJ75194.1 transcriptional regulator [Virgisporangium ochraceum]
MVTSRPVTLVGRGELLAQAGAELAAGRSVLLWGPAGIGKSTVIDALTPASGSSPVTGSGPTLVLRAAAAEAEADLPYLALVDLFDGVLDGPTPPPLPPHLRVALDGALLRSAVPATPQDQLAVRLAVLELLRGLAAERPVLLVLDDTQWIDEPSAGVLRFVARRLGPVPVQVVAAERVAQGDSPARADLCPTPCVELGVPPLTQADVSDILRHRFGAGVPRHRLQRVYTASGGNPMFAVELGRTLQERGEVSPTGPLPVPDRLRALLAERLSRLSTAGRSPLLIAAAAARPSRDLIERSGADPDGLADAIEAGVVTAALDGAVRFTHPLLREMVYADARTEELRWAHGRLAQVVADPVERARHLAAASSAPDEDLARTLTDAAATAKLRGAPDAAADLAAMAAERTPRETPDVAAVRRLHAAQYAYHAGAEEEAHRYASAALRDAADRRTRVNARLLLIDLVGQDQSGIGPLLDAAYGDAVDEPDLLANVHLYRAQKAWYDADRESAMSELKRAAESAEQCGDAERLVEVVSWQGTVLGGPAGDELAVRAGDMAHDLPLSEETVDARHMAALRQLFAGQVADAERRIDALRDAVERTGTVRELMRVLLYAANILARAGRCADAVAAGHACLRLYLDVAPTPGPALIAAATAEMYGGSVAAAADLAERALAESLSAGDEDWLRGAYAIGGQVHQMRGDSQAAVDLMRQCYDLEQRLSRTDPSVLLWHADFVEALVAAGARDEAADVLADVRARAHRLDRTVVLLGLDRAEAVLVAATKEARDGVTFLRGVVDACTEHPYPLELARAWHTLGVLERRAHRRAAARVALSEAVRRYEAIGAAPWLEIAEAELLRLDGARAAGLSDTERRIVELVRAGSTNREIARSLFLSIKAVEANLTRLYRRLGVRNRAQLARVLDTTASD